ncbi:MAG TPA: hypothetical protein PKA64_23110 [Myxococcota bacterium]|nr:hypothetical protein [Myxococcota bacterium]
MAKAEQSSPETLFHHWRRGDETAGKAMAQRFTDWYYAMAVSRLGEPQGEAAFRSATSRFSKGVLKQEDPRRLLSWAHQIARKQIHGQLDQGRPVRGDLPNAFTRRRPPSSMLQEARTHLPEPMSILDRCYRGGGGDADPLRILRARYALKSWLRAHMDVPFRVTPHEPDPDRAPLTFYEAGRMTNESEETLFELYMLNDQEICQDVAEFAHFAMALRSGELETPAATAAPRPMTTTEEFAAQPAAPQPAPVAQAPQQAAPKRSTSNVPAMLIALATLVALLAALWAAIQWMTDAG